MEKNILYEDALRRFQIEQQKNYRESLENQIKHSRRNHSMSNNIVNLKSFQQNVPVNPYCIKDTNLGKSRMEHNPILNPIPDYKHNRYLYNSGSTASLKFSGSNVFDY